VPISLAFDHAVVNVAAAKKVERAWRASATKHKVSNVLGPLPIPRRSGANLLVLRMRRDALVPLLMILGACGGREGGPPAESGTSGIGGQPEAGARSGSGSGLGTSGATGSESPSGSAISGTGSGGIAAGSSGGGGSGAASGPCSDGAVACQGLSTVVCAGGQWAPFGDECLYACNDGSCTGVCTPTSVGCSENAVQTCASDGQWTSGVACPEATPFCDQGRCVATADTPEPPSCRTAGNGLSNCGPGATGTESCCTSLSVPGGTFYRSYDGVSCPGGPDAGVGDSNGDPGCYTSQAYPATVSGFRLDKYEITVARFRQFVNAVVGGWLPTAGAGKHAYLNGGQGLADSSSPGAFETGWNEAWTSATSPTGDQPFNLPTTLHGWQENLEGEGSGPTWSAVAGPDDSLPIKSLDWYEAYAFCIWDGGFLPSETEWNYAASGGGEQRVYPWSSPQTSAAIDCTYADYLGLVDDTVPCLPYGGSMPPQVNSVGFNSPKGDGKWSHADLAGNVWEWTLDFYAPYVTPCTDCAYVGGSSGLRVSRGGGGTDNASRLLASTRAAEVPWVPSSLTFGGARCAREP
jgi:sulfatase modifying factor 1